MATARPEQGMTISIGPPIARRLEAIMAAFAGLSRHATGIVALQIGIESLESDPESARRYLPPYARHVVGRQLHTDEAIEVEVEVEAEVLP